MSHFAKIENNIVTNVIVAEQEFIDTQDGTWVQTSYNTRGNVHYGQDGNADGGVALRGNYAGIGYTYDPSANIFISKKPYDSWVKNLQGSKDDGYIDWDPPIAWPGADVEYTDPWGNKSPYYWKWNEDNSRWEGIQIYEKDSDDLGVTKSVYWDPSSSTAKDI